MLLMSLLLQFCGEVLESLGGHIAQYLGDGILTYFGFPESDPDAAQHAVEVRMRFCVHVLSIC